uniref:Uncharacterized protein n=1 Tax=Panagrellus redivivus TaxID=6233 RepID=A0A7E4VQB0_PANRE
MDTSGSDPNAKENHTTLQYEEFVYVFEERAYALNACRTIKRPLQLLFGKNASESRIQMQLLRLVIANYVQGSCATGIDVWTNNTYHKDDFPNISVSGERETSQLSTLSGSTMKTVQLVLIASLLALSLAAIVKRENIQEIHYPNLAPNDEKTTTLAPVTLGTPQEEKSYLAQILDFIFGLFAGKQEEQNKLGFVDPKTVEKFHPIILGPPVNHSKIEEIEKSASIEKIEKPASIEKIEKPASIEKIEKPASIEKIEKIEKKE